MSGSDNVFVPPARGVAGLVLAWLLIAALPAAAQQVSLGSAESFGVIGRTGVSNTGASAVIGDVGVGLAGSVTGFPPGTVDENSDVRAGDAVAVQALLDARHAYEIVDARTCPSANNLTGLNLGGRSLAAGVYCFDGNAQLTGTLTLTGAGPWTFQVGGLLTIDPSAQVLAPAVTTTCKGSSVQWQVAGASATVGASASVIGNILALNDVGLGAAAQLDGRAIAIDGDVTMSANQVAACSFGGRFPPHAAIKVTGGGQIWVPDPDSTDSRRTGHERATFAFVAIPGEAGSDARGRFLYLNHANRGHLQGFGPVHTAGRVQHIDVVDVDADGSPRTVRFDGICERRPNCTFSVLVRDNGEGRRDGDDDDDEDHDGEVDDDNGGDHHGSDTASDRPDRPRDLFGVVIVSGGEIVEARAIRPIARGNIQFHRRPAPALTTDLNDVEFDRGDSMAVGASLGRGPSATLADAYVVLELPNGQLMSWTGGGLVPGLVPVARGFVPFQFDTSLLQLVIPRGAPAGRYTWLSALTQAGTLNLLTPISESVFTIK
jgi:hypothetical protein